MKRNIGLCIFLSIITCGIYFFYWFIKVTDEMNTAAGQTDTSGGVSFLLDLITCGIYGIYWGYKMGQKVQTARANRNMPADQSLSVLYLLLNIFELQIITLALVQNELNNLAA